MLLKINYEIISATLQAIYSEKYPEGNFSGQLYKYFSWRIDCLRNLPGIQFEFPAGIPWRIFFRNSSIKSPTNSFIKSYRITSSRNFPLDFYRIFQEFLWVFPYKFSQIFHQGFLYVYLNKLWWTFCKKYLHGLQEFLKKWLEIFFRSLSKFSAGCYFILNDHICIQDFFFFFWKILWEDFILEIVLKISQ